MTLCELLKTSEPKFNVFKVSLTYESTLDLLDLWGGYIG